MKRLLTGLFALFLVLILTYCQPEKEQQPFKIAISKAVPAESYKYYIQWLKSADSTVICLDMYHLGIDSAIKALSNCDGLLITGGEDVNPEYYGREFDSIKCDLPNDFRDSLDLLLIENALKHNIPIMGICRGLQILNVYFGGSLIFDIPSDFDTTVKHRFPEYKASQHDVRIINGALLQEITGVSNGNTNSNHHQGIDKLAPLLTGSTYTEDGLVEAIELKEKEGKPYVLGVQWHPERMDYANPLSGNLAVRFLDESRIYSNK